MKIQRTVYTQLLQACPVPPPETGGILGGRNGIVTTFALDRLGTCGTYSPDAEKLNLIISDWEKQGIAFLGIFHTHPLGDSELSIHDRSYVERIMIAMPSRISKLYFPLVFPGDRMLSFAAEEKFNGICIHTDAIKFIWRCD